MLTLDGRPVAAVGSLLETCRAAGVDLPAFCHDDRLSVGGHCRACLVEADGRWVAACTTPARDRMVVTTGGERLCEYRRDLGELMLAESRPEGVVAGMLAAWGARGERYGNAAGRREDPGSLPTSGAGAKRRGPPRGGRLPGSSRLPDDAGPDHTHPYLRLDLSRCILCRRCVRACEEIQGQFVYAVTGRGARSRLSWGGGRFVDSPCVGCGACVTACPSGAIGDADRERADDTTETRTVHTTCSYCGVGCQLEVRASADAIVRIDGVRDAAANHGHLCIKGRYAHGFARHPDRLTRPLVRRDGALVATTWDEAIDRVARELARRRGAVAGLSSSRCTNEENYLFQKWFRAGLGTNDVDCCARVCHAPSAAGMREAFGTGAATNSLADIERADLVMVVGANVTEAHPVTGARIRQAALRGVPLVVVDPRRTELAAIADLHLQVRPGTNVPLLNALACVLVEEDLVDRRFVAERVSPWEAYEPFIRAHTPERWESVTGVPAGRVRAAARLYGRAARPFMAHGLGVTEHYQGSESVMLLCNLALLVGAVGRPGVGINPLRGQNNVQGSADMGCQPDLLTGYARVVDAAARARFEAEWGRPVPAAPGRRLPEMLDAARSGAIRGLFVLGEDIVQTDPDSGRTREALGALEFLVVQELFLSETAALAHVVLPGASFLEKDGTFTNGERRVQRVRKVLEPPGQARADWEILSSLMTATGCPQPARSPAEIMEEIARVAPPFAGLHYPRLAGDGLQWPVPDREHPGTAVLHTDGFPHGRGRLTRVDYEPSPGLGPGLTLVTGRVLEHYNAGTMTRRTPNLALAPADLLEVHPADAAARGIRNGDPVAVTSAHGEARAVARVTERVAPGVLFLSFHFPQTGANAVTGAVRDRLTGCPEYKVTAVELRHL